MLSTSTKRSLASMQGARLGRRAWLGGFAALCLPTALMAKTAPVAEAATLIQVWKGPSCACCQDWIAHLEAHGFRTQSQDKGNSDARQRLGVDLKYGSCHTALVGGYVIEGHVPAREIRRLLKERPQALGLAVPAMPIGSPGMDGPAYAGRKEPYEVLLLLKGGGASVYQRYA